jgi:hypothetical protein
MAGRVHGVLARVDASPRFVPGCVRPKRIKAIYWMAVNTLWEPASACHGAGHEAAHPMPSQCDGFGMHRCLSTPLVQHYCARTFLTSC